MSSKDQDEPRNIARREMLKRAGAVGAAAILPAAQLANPALAQSRAAAAPLREALETLTATESDILEAIVKENADRWNLATMQKTTLPFEDNVLDLDPTVKDRLGNPVIRITADWKENDRKISLYLQEKMKQWFMQAGAIETTPGPVGTQGPSTHAIGGTRMGDNKATNTVDRWGFAHEAPNLGVLGGSVMGTSGARNPTLTIQALAWRTAERLAQEWKTIAT